MRLHLPKALLAAVLAACLAWPAGASTLTSETTTIDGVKYSGYVIEYVGTGSQEFHKGTFATTTAATDPTGTDTTGKTLTITNASGNINTQFAAYSDGSVSTTGKQDLWKLFCSGNDFTHGHTLKLNSTASTDLTLTCTFKPITIGGLISTGSASSYTLTTDSSERNIELTGKSSSGVNMAIGVNTTLNAKTGAISINTGGSWVISKGKSLTLSSTSTNGVTIASGQNVNVSASGDGTGNASLAFTGNIKNSGTLSIGSGVNMSVASGKTLNTTTITNDGTITLASGAIIALDQLLATSDFTTTATTTGAHTATNGAFTFATGDGTVSVGDNLSYKYNGATATVDWNTGNKTGTASVPYYYIASGSSETYANAAANTPAWITVSEGGTLSDLPVDTNSNSNVGIKITGGGTISMSAGSEQVTISADKLTDFTGDLVVNSGRFNEVNNGHVFSNVSVADGGQFCINDSYNYTGNVSIAGTGWNSSSDYAKAGALRLGDGAKLSGNLTLTGDSNLIVYNGAKGTLSGTLDTGGHTLTVKGNGKLLFGSSVVIGSGEGNADIVAENAHIGVSNNGSLSILKDYTCKGLYSDGQGAITIGDATHTIVNSVERIELGDSGTSGKITTLTVNANSVLKITGTNNDNDYKTASAILGEWTARTTATINGTLLSEGAALQAGDTGYILNIESTGLVAAKGIQRAKSGKNPTITVNLKGGSLILGDGGIAANGTYHSATSTGGVIGSYAENMTITSALSLTSGTTTIDTSKYTINADNTVTVPTTGATGSTITISGNISGSEGTKLEVTGEGEVILSGTKNNLQELRLSGGTTTISGTTTVNVTNSGDDVKGIVAANDDIILTVSSTGKLIHDGFEYAGTNLSGLKNGLSMWNGNNAGTIRYNVLVSGGTITQTSEDPAGKTINADLSDVRLINGTKMKTTFGVDAELSGASISGTLEVGNNTTTTIKNSVTGSTDSSIATLTGSGTLKTTAGETSVTNATGFSGTLESTGGTLRASGSLSSFNALKATGGDVILQAAEGLSLKEVVVSSGSSVSAFTTNSEYVNYSVDNVNVGDGGGSLIGNLTINNNGMLTFDASAGTSGTGLALSYATTYAEGYTTTTAGSLTLGSGLTLNLANLGRLATGESLTLFSGVTEVNGLSNDDLTSMQSGTLAAETVFNGVGTGNYNLRYSGNVVSLVAQKDTPEPTTATLSLLALMALAARRRRKA